MECCSSGVLGRGTRTLLQYSNTPSFPRRFFRTPSRTKCRPLVSANDSGWPGPLGCVCMAQPVAYLRPIRKPHERMDVTFASRRFRVSSDVSSTTALGRKGPDGQRMVRSTAFRRKIRLEYVCRPGPPKGGTTNASTNIDNLLSPTKTDGPMVVAARPACLHPAIPPAFCLVSCSPLSPEASPDTGRS
jgi:hypothetical protein